MQVKRCLRLVRGADRRRLRASAWPASKSLASALTAPRTLAAADCASHEALALTLTRVLVQKKRLGLGLGLLAVELQLPILLPRLLSALD